MKYVYAVTSGEYSDYHVDAIFSTKEKAEAFKNIMQYSEYNKIEKYELDPSTVDLIKRGYSVWRVHMLIDGTTEMVRQVPLSPYNITPEFSIRERSLVPAYKNKRIPDVLNANVWAKTEKHAIKIVNEYRTRMIAEGKWK